MDSDRLTASGFEDFVRVDGEIGSSNSEGSEESVVEERVADEIDEVNEEGEGERNQPYERKVLPEELSRKVMTLTCESTADGGSICDVYLAGTAHVSAVVFLELCSGCVAILTPQNLKVRISSLTYIFILHQKTLLEKVARGLSGT
ncbi:hypothetical protein BC332_19148 [Capsicum chinense]|nr:hypothetical protein BC332_19148 [Capsicum chinense]